jgi:probable addiction module antidote protein
VAPYDSADYLKTEEDIKNHLEAVFEDPMGRQMLIHTLGVVARSRGMMKLSKETGSGASSPNSWNTAACVGGLFPMRVAVFLTS